MQEQAAVLVLVGERQWTWDVLHNACVVARQRGGRVVLMQMVRVQHIAHLGAVVGCAPPDEYDLADLQAYADTAADYGLDYDVQTYQYYDAFGAIAEASSQAGASVVFARLPASIIPFWSECRFEVLRQRLAHQGIELHDRPVQADAMYDQPVKGSRLPRAVESV